MVRKEKGRLKVSWLKNLVYRLIELEAIEGIEVSLFVACDETIRALNKKYRGKDKATDVLSFVFNEKVGKRRLLGEIILSVDTAERQAKEMGHSLEEEVKRLVVHGFVHLLGYDHEAGKQEERAFREKEKKLLSSL